MPGPWFRIAYSRNAFVRLLAERDQSVETLSLAAGIRAMLDFREHHKPQHAELDELSARWAPVQGGYEFSIVRRMHRHDHPESELALTFRFAPSRTRTAAGSTVITSLRDATATAGYRAISRAAIVDRQLTQS